MLRRNRVAVALACFVGAALLSPVPSGAAPAGAKKVGSDSTGDWGAHSPLAHTPGQEAGGPTAQDLIEAHIGMADKKTVNFIITVSSLPVPGGVPEAVRYVWSMQVDGERVELDGRFTNYSGGACDPGAGCPPPRDPGAQPFVVRGNCSGSGDDACDEVGAVEAAFSPADGTVTIPVPLKMLGARAGSKIAPFTSDLASRLGGTIVAFTAAASSSGSPADGLTVDKTFTVPGAKKKK
jgi:hypothetical protein